MNMPVPRNTHKHAAPTLCRLCRETRAVRLEHLRMLTVLPGSPETGGRSVVAVSSDAAPPGMFAAELKLGEGYCVSHMFIPKDTATLEKFCARVYVIFAACAQLFVPRVGEGPRGREEERKSARERERERERERKREKERGGMERDGEREGERERERESTGARAWGAVCGGAARGTHLRLSDTLTLTLTLTQMLTLTPRLCVCLRVRACACVRVPACACVQGGSADQRPRGEQKPHQQQAQTVLNHRSLESCLRTVRVFFYCLIFSVSKVDPLSPIPAASQLAAWRGINQQHAGCGPAS